jgi:hypothetical protein
MNMPLLISIRSFERNPMLQFVTDGFKLDVTLFLILEGFYVLLLFGSFEIQGVAEFIQVRN